MIPKKIVRDLIKDLEDELKSREEWLREKRKAPREEMDQADKEIFKDYANSLRVFDGQIYILKRVLGEK